MNAASVIRFKPENILEGFMRALTQLTCLVFVTTAVTREAISLAAISDTGLWLREIQYDGRLTDREARFWVELDAESVGRKDSWATLFEGDVAVLPAKLPAGLRITREGRQYRLIASRPGQFKFKLEVVARISRVEAWNQVSFTGPAAGIASVTAQANTADVEIQLLSGTPVEPTAGGGARARGVLGADRNVALRWQSKTVEAARQPQVTCQTAGAVQLTPTVIKFVTELRYDIVQGNLAKFSVRLPGQHALTRVEGDHIRDWHATVVGDRQILAVDLIKPAEKSYCLKLFSEEPVDRTPFAADLTLPEPQGVDRESGSLTVWTDDTAVEIAPTAALRQVSAPTGAQAAYLFYRRPLTVEATLRRIEPVIRAASRVTARLEPARLWVSHAFTLNVEQAGLYSVELSPLGPFTVTGVRGPGVEEWTVRGGRVLVNFSSRVLGERELVVQLEQGERVFPTQIVITPLAVAGARRQIAQIGAGSAPGIRLKTAGLSGLREIPVGNLTNRTDELLAYVAEKDDWSLKLAAEELAPRIVADVFNLVTVGDGLVGGSATIRYVIANQGVQEFRVQLPARWKNLEFTGPNIRRKEPLAPTPANADTNSVVWRIALQDKAWDGYTLVVTYDEPFDPHRATLGLGSLRTLGVERETGTIAITSAASLQLREARRTGPLQRMDERELAETDRALITRSVLLAYRYGTTDPYQLDVEVTRFQELPVLDAVADRTQLTTVLTEAGQMLTQASFLVKNNDKQFQRFTLPPGAEFWSAYVDGEPVKAEKQQESLLVPLPRGANRDQAFAVEIVYAQNLGSIRSLWPRQVALAAPKTDIQTTFAQWELYVPATHQLAKFDGNMNVARGTTYGLRDAVAELVRAYRGMLNNNPAVLRGDGPVAQTAYPQREEALQRSESNRPAGATDGVASSALPAPANAGMVMTAARTKANWVQGIRPIHIEIPRVGQRFVFTKVLNLGDETLRLEAWAITATVLKVFRGALQAGAFLAGLWLLRRQLRRGAPNSFMVALAVALMLASLGSLLIVTRLLGRVLIVAVPLLVLAVLAVLAWRYGRRRRGDKPTVEPTGQPPTPPALPPGAAGAGPVIASLALLLLVRALAAKEPTQPESARRTTPSALEAVSISSATYTGAVRERVAEIQAVIRVSTAAAGQTIPLFGEDVAVEAFSAPCRGVRLLHLGNTLSARLPSRGEATLKVKFLVKLGGDATQRQLAFAIPPALSSRLQLALSEPEAAVEFPTAVSYRTVPTPGQTQVEAVIGAGERVDLRWTPRVKRAAEIAATVFSQNATRVTFSGGAVQTHSVLDYQVTQGELRRARVGLPAGERLLRVEGDSIRTWRLADEGGAQVLTVELLKGVSPGYRLRVDTERTLDKLPDTFAVETPHALEVKREAGYLGLGGSDELGLTFEHAQGLQQVDAAEFQKETGQTNALAGAFRFSTPAFALRVRVQPLLPQIEAVTCNRLRIAAEQLQLSTQVDYTVKRVGVFTLRLALPGDFHLESVAGKEIAQWSEKSVNAARVLEITLKQRTLGNCTLQLQLTKPQPGLPQSVAVAGVRPLDTAKLTGFVVVSPEAGLAARTASLEGLTEVPLAQVPEGGTGLAYKLTSSNPAPAHMPWNLVVALETIEPWVRAEVVDWLMLGDTLVTGRALVRYEIQNAPVQEFRLRVPGTFKNVEITGPNIRARDRNGEEWRVRLQNKVVGAYLLTVTWEQAWSVREQTDNGFDVVGVGALGVERETGALVVMAKPELQVAPRQAGSELIRVDPQELPEWAGPAKQTTVLAYRYLRPGYQLSVSARRFAEAEVLQALADEERLTTVVAEDGQMMTELELSIRNNGRQFLEVALPDGAQVWSAFVAGQAVRPGVRRGKLLLPIERTEGVAVNVDLIYVCAEKFPRTRGNVALASPALDVPVKNARWELFLPAGYGYSRFGGTMSREAAAAPVYSSFTLNDYSAAETRDKRARALEVSSSLGAARQTLSLGKLDAASKAFNQARRYGSEEEQGQLRELEKDLRKAQGSNLRNAQQAVIANNAFYLERSSDRPAQPPALHYDDKAAEQQWARLQQAQEVATISVRPLRVHLPTRGLRQSFSQVLQTDVGKPMRIQFVAANASTSSWPLRIAAVAVAFAGVWLLAKFALDLRTTS